MLFTKNMIKRIKRLWAKIKDRLLDLCADEIDLETMVLHLVMNTAGMALKRDQFVQLAGVKGTCGPFILSGNCIPMFTYKVFDKKIMEFIEMTVYVSKPKKIEFKATLNSTDKNNHGKLVEIKKEYCEPFYVLATHLFHYFPYPYEGGRKEIGNIRQVEKVQVQNSNT